MQSRLLRLFVVGIMMCCTSCYYLSPDTTLNQQLKRDATSYVEYLRSDMDEFVDDNQHNELIQRWVQKSEIQQDLNAEFQLKRYTSFIYQYGRLIYWSDEHFSQEVLRSIQQLSNNKGLFRDGEKLYSFRKKSLPNSLHILCLFDISQAIKAEFPNIQQIGFSAVNPNAVSELSLDDVNIQVLRSTITHTRNNALLLILGILFFLGLFVGSKKVFSLFERRKPSLALASWVGMLGLSVLIFNQVLAPLWDSSGIALQLQWPVLGIILSLWSVIIGTRLLQPIHFQLTSKVQRYCLILGSYIIIQGSFIVIASYFYHLVSRVKIPLDFENFFFFNPASILALTSIILLSISFFLIHYKLLNEIAKAGFDVRHRLGWFGLSALAMAPVLLSLNIGVSLIPFMLATGIYLILYELFIESKQNSITWIVTWLILFSGFSAILLFKFNWQKDLLRRFDYAMQLDPQAENISSDYRLAIYHQNNLSKTNAADLFPAQIELNINDQPFQEIIENGRSSLCVSRGDFTIVVDRKIQGLIKPISLFSFIFGLFLLLTVLLASLNTLSPFLPFQLNLRFSNRRSLRTKIQWSVISVILASFVIIAIITVFYFKNSAETNQENQIRSKLSAIVQSLSSQARVEDARWVYSEGIPDELSNMSQINEASIQIFDLNGLLVTEAIFDSSQEIATHRLPFEIFNELRKGTSLTNITNTKNQLVSYATIKNKASNPVAYIAIPDMTLSNFVRKNVNEFIGTLLNVYIFLLLLAGSVAIAVANSITRPLVALGENLKQIKLGQQNQTLEWENQDEVGELIQNYNEMINKLEDSAQLLAMTERELAWREMAKQVAHEIKNPLTPMKLIIQHMQHAIKSRPEEVSSIVDRVSSTLIEQIEALSQIASEFSNFADMPKPENEKVVLNEIVAGTHDLFRKREDMNINLYVPIDEIYVFADKSHLFRVLNNLVKNAIQAIPNTRRGEINIKLYKNQDMAVIRVTDNGTGIPDAMKDKVFYPNFTTKSSGTGLGLAISANIIQSFNGDIYFETKQNEGTEFYVELPLMHMKDNYIIKKRVAL